MYLDYSSLLALYAAADTSVAVGALGVLGIAITAYFGWLGVKRATSGKIETTEAAKLWEEAGTMRTELRTEVASLRAENATLKNDNRVLTEKFEALETRFDQMQEDFKKRDAISQARIRELEGANG